MEKDKYICRVHGEMTIDNFTTEYDKRNPDNIKIKYRCKHCKKVKDLRYREKYRKELSNKNVQYKKENREVVNAWNRKDRKENPEKYRRYEANYINKHGIEKVRKREVARIHNITVEEYDRLHKQQNGICQICGKEETRLSRKEKERMPLCIDHCHACKEKGQHVIRGLICHKCNSAMGKLNDDIAILKSMISYLEAHQHV